MTPSISTPKMRNQAFQLRHAPTEAENKLWNNLRAHRLGNTHFCRQYAIGNYIVDFCAPRRKLIIELDGHPHTTSRENDEEGNVYLQAKGYRVLRFWNSDVIDRIEEVLKMILDAVNN